MPTPAPKTPFAVSRPLSEAALLMEVTLCFDAQRNRVASCLAPFMMVANSLLTPIPAADKVFSLELATWSSLYPGIWNHHAHFAASQGKAKVNSKE